MHVVSVMLKAAESLRGIWDFIVNIVDVWPSWPALRALVLPRFRLACNGLTAMMESGSLGADEGRHALAAVFMTAGVATNVTASVHQCGWSAEFHTVPNPLVKELAQVLVLQPQFLQLLKAGTAWARQHAHMDFSHLYSSASVSFCLDEITVYGMNSLHQCLCPNSPSTIDPASPKLCQAAHDWFVFALEMLKAGGWLGNSWSADTAGSLLKYGMVIPLTIMTRRVELQSCTDDSLPWADRPRYLECALAGAEWLLSAAGANSCNEDGVLNCAWQNCADLALALATGRGCYCKGLPCILYVIR